MVVCYQRVETNVGGKQMSAVSKCCDGRVGRKERILVEAGDGRMGVPVGVEDSPLCSMLICNW